MEERRSAIQYMSRTRAYYSRLGFARPYEWAHFDDVPFTPLAIPLHAATISIVTTAAIVRPDSGDQGPGAAYNGKAKFFDVYAASIDELPPLSIAHVAYDRSHTSARDQSTYIPLDALLRLRGENEIGAVGRHIIGLPTDRSKRKTEAQYAAAVYEIASGDGADAVVLVPNCPVCHQSAALVARYLEAQKLPTLVFGCARDIIENVRVPRFYFSDFPLGNAVGKPFDQASQDQTVRGGLELFKHARATETVINPISWAPDDNWKADYCNLNGMSVEAVAALRQDFEREKQRAPRRK